MGKILGIIVLYLILIISNAFSSDEKPGRFFEDQPDVTDDNQIVGLFLLENMINKI